MGRRHILTGAGFTHNFGGPLASEMWALIFNEIDAEREPALKERLRREFDFETVYREVMKRPGHDSEQKALAKAVGAAFEYIDTKTIAHNGPGSGRHGSKATEMLAAALWSRTQDPSLGHWSALPRCIDGTSVAIAGNRLRIW
jgi:hypothetical protein